MGLNDRRKKERQEIYNTKRWVMLRDYMRATYPLCQDCLKQGRITPMQEVHHILSPFVRNISQEEKERRAFDVYNLVCLCSECHHKRHGTDRKINIKDYIQKYK